MRPIRWRGRPRLIFRKAQIRAPLTELLRRRFSSETEFLTQGPAADRLGKGCSLSSGTILAKAALESAMPTHFQEDLIWKACFGRELGKRLVHSGWAIEFG